MSGISPIANLANLTVFHPQVNQTSNITPLVQNIVVDCIAMAFLTLGIQKKTQAAVRASVIPEIQIGQRQVSKCQEGGTLLGFGQGLAPSTTSPRFSHSLSIQEESPVGDVWDGLEIMGFHE